MSRLLSVILGLLISVIVLSSVFQSIETNKHTIELYLLPLASIVESDLQATRAEVFSSRASERWPYSEYYNKARAYWLADDKTTAIKVASRIPNIGCYFLNYGNVAFVESQKLLASELFGAAYSLDLSKCHTGSLLVMYRSLCSVPEETLRVESHTRRYWCQVAVDLAPSNWTLIDLGRAYYYEQDYDQALEIFQEAVNRGPVVPPVFLWVGRSHFALSNTEEAETAFRDGLSLDPTNLGLNFEMGRLKMTLGDNDSAVCFLDIAIQGEGIFAESAGTLRSRISSSTCSASK